MLENEVDENVLDSNKAQAVVVTERDLLLPNKPRFSESPNFIWIEVALLSNVFLYGFDSTVTASTYTTIGNQFNANDIASWITTSYLITATAFQPLYGSFSDVIGRKKCCFFALLIFGIGCLGCALAPDIYTLNLMRAITGLGGGGLITLSTIINSDIIFPRKRGLFQAVQNILVGMGCVAGASFGGVISSYFGWRWCFLCQIPPALMSIYVGSHYIKNQPGFDEAHSVLFSRRVLKKIDLSGSAVLVVSLTLQIFFLTLVSENQTTDWRIWALGIIGFSLLGYFVYLEYYTKSDHPIMPVRLYKSWYSGLLLAQNFMIGLSALSYLFTLPLLFQIVLGDSPSRAGLRLGIPSLSTPIGGVVTGVLMNKYGCLKSLVYTGTFIMSCGNYLALCVSRSIPSWAIDLLLIPANIGQGMAYPSSLFTFIFAFGSAHQATSTSTVYLMRSIGGVWGVSCVSSIIQAYVKFKVREDLHNLTDLSSHDIKKIITKVTKSTDTIKYLPETVRDIVLVDYERGIRIAQLFSSVCCTLGFLFCLAREFVKRRNQQGDV